MNKYILFTMVFLTPSLSGIAQDLPTIGEIFNFNIGDEYHYQTFNDWWADSLYTRDKIIDVVYSIDSNEVIHTIVRDGYDPNDSTFFGPDTLSYELTDLDSSMIYFNNNFLYDTVHYFSDGLCSAEIYGTHYLNQWQNIVEIEYGIGLGFTRYSSILDTGYFLQHLVYYKKEGEECGPSNIMSIGINSPLNSLSISIFPTLFTDLVTIESEYEGELNIQLYSISGNEILFERINSPSVQLDLGFMKPGTYIYVISNKDNQVIKSGRIIKGE